MNGLTGLGRGLSPSMGISGNYSRNDGGKFSSPALYTNFPKNLPQLSQEDDDENLPDISERLNAINRESHLPFEGKNNFRNHFAHMMQPHEDDLPFGKVSFQQNPMGSLGFMPVNEALSGSFSNNNVSLNASIFGNDALQFITTLQGIISSPVEYQRHKENGTLPTERDLKTLENNMLGQLQKLTAEKTNKMPHSDETFGGVKNMFQQNMQQKHDDIQKLIGGATQDVSGLQDALKNISGI